MSKEIHTPPPDTGIELATLPWSQENQLRIRWKRFKGNEFLDLRVWDGTKNSEDFFPTARGISVSPSRFEDFRTAMLDAFERVDEILAADRD